MLTFRPTCRFLLGICFFLVLIILQTGTHKALSQESEATPEVEVSLEPVIATPTEAVIEPSPEPATATPTPIQTEEPAPVPTEEVTEEPVIEPTVEAIEEVPQATATIEATEEPVIETTAEITEEVPQVTATAVTTPEGPPSLPPMALLYSSNFDDGDMSLWLLGTGWTLVTNESGQALQADNATEALQSHYENLLNVAVQARFWGASQTAVVSVRQSMAGAYAAALNLESGQLDLFRGNSLVASANVSTSDENQWRTLRLTAIGGELRVAVDAVDVLFFSDDALLPPGTVSLAISGTGGLVDDVELWVPEDELALIPTPSILSLESLMQPAAPMNVSGSISGTVYDQQQQVIENQRVWIDSEDSSLSDWTCTNASGVYTFSNLTVDRNYYIRAGGDYGCNGLLPLTVQEFWDNSHNWPGTLIPVTTGTPDITGKDFTLEPAGYVSGTVTDATTGNPLENMNVNVDLGDGWGIGACTNSSGQYTILGVPLNRDIRVNAPAGDNWCGGPDNYVEEYWDGQTSWSAANTFQLTTPGENASGKNFAIEVGGSITGTVTDAVSGNPLQSMVVNFNWVNHGFGVCTDELGNYTANHLPLNVAIQVQAGQSDNWCGGSTNYVQQQQNGIVLTTSGEQLDRDFALETGFVISGTVSDGSGNLLENIWVTTENNPYGGCTDANGEYSMTVAAGDYVLRAGQVCGSSTTPWAEMLYENAFDIDSVTVVHIDSGSPTASGKNFTLIPGGTITGTVRDANTHAALLNVKVELDLNGYGIGTCTDQFGNYTLSGAPQGIDVRVHAGGGTNWCGGSVNYIQEYWQEVSNWDEATVITFGPGHLSESGVDFTLEFGGVISGRVTDWNGNGVNNANVEIETMDGQWVSGSCADSNGYYTVALPLGVDYRLRTGRICSPFDYTPYAMQWWNGASHPSGATAITLDTGSPNAPNINLVLQSGGTISGTVKEPGTNSPLQNMVVNADFGGWGIGVCTDANGQYTIYGLPTDSSYRVSAAGGDNWCGGPTTFLQQYYNEKTSWDAADLVAVPSANPDVENIDFTLQPGGTVSGTVRNAQGQRLANVNVGLEGYPIGTCTDVNGNYLLTGVPYSTEHSVSIGGYNWCQGATQHYVHQWWNNKQWWHERDLFTVDSNNLHVTDKDFVAVTGGLITGTVRNVTGTSTLDNVNVGVESQNFGEGDCTHDGGQYAIVVPLNGSYRVQASGMCGGSDQENDYVREYWQESPNYDGATLVVVSSEDPLADNIDFTLEEGAQISGTVFAANGTTRLPNVFVSLTYPDGGWVEGQCTDSNGEYTIHGVPNGNFVVYAADSWNQCNSIPNIYVQEWYNDKGNADDANLVTVTGGANVSAINFTLDVGGVITGHIYAPDGQTPVENAWVGIEDADTGWGFAGTQTDQNGFYQFAGLTARNVLLRVEAQDYAMEYYDDAGQNRDNADPLAVTLGNTISGIDFVLAAGGYVNGRVMDNQGAPLANMLVEAPHHWLGTCTDASGNYSLGGLPLNEPIWVHTNSANNWCENGSNAYIDKWWEDVDRESLATTVEATTTAQPVLGIDFSLSLGGAISGTVLAATEPHNPIEGAWTCTMPYDSPNLKDALTSCRQTDNDGNYTIYGVRPGPQHVWVFDPNWIEVHYDGLVGWDGATPVDVMSGQTTPNIDFLLPPGAIITGTVYQPDGVTPQGHIMVSLPDGSYPYCIWPEQQGQYRLRVPEGTHVIMASVGFCGGEEFPAQYYDGVTGIGAATPITATLGTPVADIDFVNISAAVCPFVTEIPGEECDALTSLYDATNGDNWTTATGWQQDFTPCDWFGVTCETGHVTALDLQSNNLTGAIPPELGGLSQLKTLQLSLNHLSSTLPPEVGQLTNLITLDVSQNHLIGPLPTQLGNLVNLQALHLEQNAILGDFPASIMNLSALNDTDLSYNGLNSPDAAVTVFLNAKDPDWAETQTVPPMNVTTGSPGNDSLIVSWMSIAYTSDPGYYEVGYRIGAAGPFAIGCATADKAETSCTVPDLVVGTVYQFAVRSFTDSHVDNLNAIYSVFSAALSGSTTSLPPTTAPVLVAPSSGTALSNQTPAFDWNDVARATLYEIQIDNNSNFSSPEQSLVVSASEYQAATLADGAYSWRVRAANEAGAGPWSGARALTIDTTPPAQPALLAPVDTATTTTARPAFSWKAVAGAQLYQLHVDDSDTFTLAGLEINQLQGGTSYTPSTSLPQGTYYWRVVARDAAGNFSPADPAQVRTFTVNINRSPANGSATTNPKPAFQWYAWTGAASYQVQISSSEDFASLVHTSPVLGSGVLTYTIPAADDPLDAGTYYWRVLVNGEVPPHDWSFTVTTTPPRAPVLTGPATGTVTNDNKPLFDWNEVTGEGGPFTYELVVDNNSNFSSPELTQPVTDTQFEALPADPALPDGLYRWRVRAVNVYDVAGLWSSVRTLTIDTTPPAVPALNLPADGALVTTSRPTLSWRAAATANRYRLEISTDSDFEPGNLIALNSGGETNSTSFKPTISLPLHELYWRVEARDAAGNWSGFTPGVFNTLTVNIMNTPADQAVATDLTPAFSWFAYTGAAGGYRIEIATDTAFSNVVESASRTTTGYTSAGLTDGSYYWRVLVDLTLPAGDSFEPTTLYRTLIVSAVLPPSPVLGNVPANGVITNDSTPLFEWNGVTGTGEPFTYEIIVDNNSNFSSPVLDETVADTQFEPNLAHALADGKYYWRVRAVNTIGASGGWSATRSFTVDTVAPAIPKQSSPMTGVTITTARPTFSWGASAGATLYSVRIDGTTLVNTTSKTITPNTSLAQGDHTWEVAARDAGGNWSDFSAPQTFVVDIHRAPIDNGVTSDQTPPFQWYAFAGAVNYRLEVATDAGFPPPSGAALEVTGLSAAARSYVPTGNLPYGTYYWRVSPDEKPGVGDPYEAPPFYRTVIISPPAPPALAIVGPTASLLTNDHTPLFDWNPTPGTVNGGPFSYEIVLSRNTGFTDIERTVNAGDATDYTPDELDALADGVYYWRVRAINVYGVAGAWNTARKLTIDTLPPAIVPLLTPADLSTVTTARPRFTWAAVAGANRYRLEIDTSPSFGDIDEYRGEAASTSLTINVSLDQGTHYWRVLARDAAGNWNEVFNVQQFTVDIHKLPANNSYTTDTTPAFQWFAWTGAAGYQVDLARDSAFTDLVTGFPINVGGSTLSYTLPAARTLTYGTYYWRVSVNAPGRGVVPSPAYNTFIVSPKPPAASTLIAPANGTPTNNPTPTFVWSSVADAATYEIVVDDNSNFSSPEVHGTSPVPNFTPDGASALPNDGTYYWHVRAINAYGVPGVWSTSRTVILNAS